MCRFLIVPTTRLFGASRLGLGGISGPCLASSTLTGWSRRGLATQGPPDPSPEDSSDSSSKDTSVTDKKKARPRKKKALEPMSSETKGRIESLTHTLLKKGVADNEAIEAFKPKTTLSPLQRASFVEKIQAAFMRTQLLDYIVSKGRVPRGNKPALAKMIMEIWQGALPSRAGLQEKPKAWEMDMSDEALRIRRSGNTEWVDMSSRELFFLQAQDRTLARHLEVTFQVQLTPFPDRGMLEVTGTPKAIREVLRASNDSLVSGWYFFGGKTEDASQTLEGMWEGMMDASGAHLSLESDGQLEIAGRHRQDIATAKRMVEEALSMYSKRSSEPLLVYESDPCDRATYGFLPIQDDQAMSLFQSTSNPQRLSLVSRMGGIEEDKAQKDEGSVEIIDASNSAVLDHVLFLEPSAEGTSHSNGGIVDFLSSQLASPHLASSSSGEMIQRLTARLGTVLLFQKGFFGSKMALSPNASDVEDSSVRRSQLKHSLLDYHHTFLPNYPIYPIRHKFIRLLDPSYQVTFHFRPSSSLPSEEGSAALREIRLRWSSKEHGVLGEVEAEGVLKGGVERDMAMVAGPWDLNVSSEFIRPLSLPADTLTRFKEGCQWLETGGVLGPRRISLPVEQGEGEEEWALDRTILTREEIFPLDKYILRAHRSQEMESMTEWEEVVMHGDRVISPVEEEEHEATGSSDKGQDLDFVEALIRLGQHALIPPFPGILASSSFSSSIIIKSFLMGQSSSTLIHTITPHKRRSAGARPKSTSVLESPSSPSKSRVGARKGKRYSQRVSKLSIGAPTNFQHTAHMGADDMAESMMDANKLRTQMAQVTALLVLEDGSPTSPPSEPRMPTFPLREGDKALRRSLPPPTSSSLDRPHSTGSSLGGSDFAHSHREILLT
ncbi:hypothetical protein BJ684DRAFT_20841 [Piptocephalis cylindrospora]|uniref:CRIB domain-containing protein n=1 Tax=Piptocephalis cylindrospora TaxID=1907219 RepID=A0A4P9Y3D5_9FUNG|nr:hypothetical protein BJ684DRAFT_20841 [Piptocephalis cylindrospora]|eukprot:RKP12631.1 hypothetical protein BJ684DRAFT_20841 [Piptocephalis cylindrospora]